MYLIVGLGNYGKEYENTPHNMGFLTADRLAEKIGFTFSKNKCHVLIAEGFYNGEKIMIAKPQTYMNRSGLSLSELVKKFKIPLENIIVVLDDIDLPLATIRYKAHGSAGTHNGLRDCVNQLGTQEFQRIRIGVGKPEYGDLADFVLSPIPKEKREQLDKAIDEAVEKILSIINENNK